jgi:hypothetical protein
MNWLTRRRRLAAAVSVNGQSQRLAATEQVAQALAAVALASRGSSLASVRDRVLIVAGPSRCARFGCSYRAVGDVWLCLGCGYEVDRPVMT